MEPEHEANAPFLPLTRPSISDADIESVVRVLRSGWITTGARTRDLEAAFRQITGCQHAVACTSATGGMHLALHALGIGPGDEVITPSMTWVSTVNLITLLGAKPVFVDIDPDTLMTSADRIEPLITERTRLLIPVHFAGAALALDELFQLAESRHLALIEDAAHALGAAYARRPVGERGTAIFSLHPTKNATTGEGGMLCTDDDALADRVRQLRFNGLTADAFDRSTGARTAPAEVLEPGFKYNLPDMNAALGIGQLERLEALNARRAALAHLYHHKLAGVDEILPLVAPPHTTRHAWHLYVVRLDADRAGLARDALMTELKARGIGSGLHFRAVHQHRFYRKSLRVDDQDLPNTSWNSERILSLPLFPDMREADVLRVVETIKNILAGVSSHARGSNMSSGSVAPARSA